jgi:hypothetical protein
VRQTGHGPVGRPPSLDALSRFEIWPTPNWVNMVSLWSGVDRAEKRQDPQLLRGSGMLDFGRFVRLTRRGHSLGRWLNWTQW